MLETQITQVASSSSRAQGRFHGQCKTNPIKHFNAIILRSGKVLEEPALSKEDEDGLGNKKIEATRNHP